MEHRPVFAMLGTIVGVVVALLVLTTVGCGASSPPPIAERDAATATPPTVVSTGPVRRKSRVRPKNDSRPPPVQISPAW